ncbi:MAG: hypothetical protein KGL39_52835 [Patescibacteria group bacterium]|nr:hypothetical protein [Patescibacteria group bacterium]
MSKQREALNMALDALEYSNLDEHKFNKLLAATRAIREALAEPEQEPATVCDCVECDCTTRIHADGSRETWCGSDAMRHAVREGSAFRLLQAPSQQAAGVPDGWQLVPIEPTQEMLDAAGRASMQHMIDCINDPKFVEKVGSEEYTLKTWASRYKSMLSAAPKAPAPAQCPRPANTRPDNFTAEQCVQAGECGCSYGQLFKLHQYLLANYPNSEGEDVVVRAIGVIQEQDIALGMASIKATAPAQWQKMSDQPPPPDSYLLVAWGDHQAVDKAHTFSKWKHPACPLGFIIQGHPGSHNDVTHWMLLPTPAVNDAALREKNGGGK